MTGPGRSPSHHHHCGGAQRQRTLGGVSSRPTWDHAHNTNQTALDVLRVALPPPLKGAQHSVTRNTREGQLPPHPKAHPCTPHSRPDPLAMSQWLSLPPKVWCPTVPCQGETITAPHRTSDVDRTWCDKFRYNCTNTAFAGASALRLLRLRRRQL